MRLTTRICVVCIAAVLSASITTAAFGSDLHRNYPAVPSGYAAIVRAFGQPCNADAYRNATTWRAADTSDSYPIRYHARLGGSVSTVLHDVIHHITVDGRSGEVRSGIYAYSCRRKRGDDSEWSPHAWGIAFDISSRFEHFRHDHCHVVSRDTGAIWTAHRWRWGLAWGDCMHFQYAAGY
jgi:D-alanyl-D-alanine carboxypeptidase-like protein